jgi:CheY-like chemotaxis protein
MKMGMEGRHDLARGSVIQPGRTTKNPAATMARHGIRHSDGPAGAADLLRGTHLAHSFPGARAVHGAGIVAMSMILIVEDDASIREAVGEVLSEEGYDVALAQNGAEALRCLQERRPDAILLDLMMPVMNGWEFRARQLRDPAFSAIPVIVVSAANAAHTVQATAYIAKPFDLNQLLQEVQRVSNSH